MSKINQTEVKNEAKFALGLWAIMILFANVIHPNALIIMTGYSLHYVYFVLV
ncbi:hypothetical protein [Aerococcus urinaeequi]|uniref:hypothetical protein n=1 Tax=Aerococcus urinaeequi TaxID=51665 RepID=UPI003D6C4C41